MHSTAQSPTGLGFGRHAQIAEVAASVRTLLSRGWMPVAVVLAFETVYMWFTNHPGTGCFAMIAASTLLLWTVWRSSGVGLPIVPMLALQNLIVYGLPLVVSNETVMKYPVEMLNAAGIEILVFSGALAIAWRSGMAVIGLSPARCYALIGFADQQMRKLSRLAFTLIGCVSAYALLRSAGLWQSVMGLLPSGSSSIVVALFSACSACGFFLAGLALGRGSMSPLSRSLFWLLLGLNCFIGAADLLLSATTTIVFSTAIGLFWGSGRLPWKFVLVVALALAFLNLGKGEMRGRYWNQEDDDAVAPASITAMPSLYSEWAVASFEAMVGVEEERYTASPEGFGKREVVEKSGQQMFERIDNLQNILFVIDAVEYGNISPVRGASYALIPALLLPRILWPEKPRTHEGQVLLNVHFGRQDARATFRTYIAWGLLAEAYGNFGPIVGTLGLGLVIGFACAWVEKFVARKLLLSLEGFLAFTLFVGMANSFEMVASVLITSLFQAFIPIIIACKPFVEPMTPSRSAVGSG